MVLKIYKNVDTFVCSFNSKNYTRIVPWISSMLKGFKKKGENPYLRSVNDIAMWIYCSLVGVTQTTPLFKDQSWKEVKNGFLGYQNYLRETIIYCISTDIRIASVYYINCSSVSASSFEIWKGKQSFSLDTFFNHTSYSQSWWHKIKFVIWNLSKIKYLIINNRIRGKDFF